jgi:hypothetical protein
VILDQSYRTIARLPAGGGRQSDLHEFLITPQNTALVTSYEDRTMDLSAIGGRRNVRVLGGIAQELEVPSARVVFEWRSLAHVAPGEAYSRIGAPFDCFHINSIEVLPDGDHLISARNTWAIYKVPRHGRRGLALNGKKSTSRWATARRSVAARRALARERADEPRQRRQPAGPPIAGAHARRRREAQRAALVRGTCTGGRRARRGTRSSCRTGT